MTRFLPRFNFFYFVLLLLVFSGNASGQTYTITGNVNSSSLACATFSGYNVIRIGNGTATPSNLIMNDDLNLSGCSSTPLQIIVNYGTIDFSTANNRLYLPEGSSISFLNGGTLNPSGGNGGGCTGNDRIYIGGIILSTCQGGAGIVSFEDIIAFDGSGNTSSNSPVCVGNSINLSATPPPKGGPFIYTWYEPSVSTSTSIGSGQNISLASATSGSHIYQVKMYSASLNKTMIANATVVVNSGTTTATPTVSLTQPTCLVATGTITITAPTGSGINYSINGLSYTNATTFSSLAAGTYNVTAKNSSGCISNATIATINAQPATPSTPTITAGGSTTFCPGGSVTLTSSAETSYLWSTGETTQSISPTTSGNYTVKGTNASGCQSASSTATTVTINPLPSITTQPINQLDCEGASVNFTAVATGTGLTYTWQRKKPTDGSFITIPSEGNVSYPSTGVIKVDNVGSSQSPSGTQYQVVATNSGGCSVTSTPATLLVNEIIGVTGGTTITQCYGTGYSYAVTTSTPSPGYVVSYQWKGSVTSGVWNNVANGIHFSGATTATLSIINGTPSESAEYRVYVTFHSSGADCNVNSSSRSRSIRFLPELTDPIATITQPDCATATGSIVLSGLPASGTWTLTRSGTSSAVTTGTGTTTTISVLASGTYNFTVTVSGCTSSASTNVVINTQPTTPTTPIVSSITQPICEVSTGSVVLNGLPASGTWTLARSGTSSETTTGTGTSTTISGLAVGTYAYTVSNGTCVSTVSGNVVISSLVTNTWSGTWSTGSLPTIDQNIIFSAGYTATTDLSGCSCTVNSGNVIINSGKTVTIMNGVTVAGGAFLTFEDSASLVQINNVPNTGNITYKRYVSIRNTDYTYWSSPVYGFTLGGVSQNKTLSDKYYSFNASVDNWQQGSAATFMTAGVGYIIRGPEPVTSPPLPPPPSLYEASFVGAPNNGNYSISAIQDKSYLLGNPYPSALDANTFLNANSNVLDGTLYFWTHKTAIGTNVSNPGSGVYAYSGDDYATYNQTGGTAVEPNEGSVPNGKIGAGQGFFASTKTTISGTTIEYSNSMRVGVGGITGSNSQFFKTRNPKEKVANPIEKNRVWLNLTNTQGVFKQTLVGYLTDATNDYDSRFDGESYDGNEFADFYSINQDKDLTIQGRALPFDENDQVSLGFRTTIDGTFTINIDQVDGLLTNQSVFIEDKLTNTVTDLKSGNYTFSTTSGTFNDRFVLRYKNNAKTLGTKNFDSLENKVLISNKNKQIKINSFAETIDKVMVYDLLGKQIYQKDKVNSNELSIANLVSSHQTLVVKTVLQNGATFTDKIIF